jgi:hypothetical protein
LLATCGNLGGQSAQQQPAGFNVKGGNGRGGGGGGAGLGGAIYVKGSGTLVVDASTFYANGAFGGNGSYGFAGGGGELSGNGGVTENI